MKNSIVLLLAFFMSAFVTTGQAAQFDVITFGAFGSESPSFELEGRIYGNLQISNFMAANQGDPATDPDAMEFAFNTGTNYDTSKLVYESGSGKKLFFAFSIAARESEPVSDRAKFRLSSVDFTFSSPERLELNYVKSNFVYGNGIYGVLWGPDNTPGTADDTFIDSTAVANTTLVDGIYFTVANSFGFNMDDFGGSESATLAYANQNTPTQYKGGYGFQTFDINGNTIITSGGATGGNYTFEASAVPEPSTTALVLIAGIAGIVAYRRRKAKS